MKIRNKLRSIIVLLFLLLSNNNAQEVLYLKDFSLGVMSGVNYLLSDYEIKKIGLINQFNFTYYFPIKSNVFNLGLSGNVQFGRFTGRSETLLPANFRNYYTQFLGGFTLQVNSKNLVLGFSPLLGLINFKPTDYDNNSLPVADHDITLKSAFVINPSLEVKTFLSKTVSLDLSISANFPFSDYLDGAPINTWDHFYDLKLGFSFYFLEDLDADDDGIPDDKDYCSGTPIGEDIDWKGCGKLTQLDDDNDGLFNIDDKCNNTSPNEFASIDENGCGPSQKDSDEDGFIDSNDRCLNTPKNEIVEINQFGCGPSERDTDEDGVNDNIDKCPRTPIDLRDNVNSEGCSDYEIDKDYDLIINNLDQCPYKAEIFNYFEDTDGCPDSTEYPYEIIIDKLNPLFLEDSTNLSIVGESILKGFPLSILQTYVNTCWIINVNSPVNPEEKSKNIKLFLDGLIKDTTRLKTNSHILDKEEIKMVLDLEKAREIFKQTQNGE